MDDTVVNSVCNCLHIPYVMTGKSFGCPNNDIGSNCIVRHQKLDKKEHVIAVIAHNVTIIILNLIIYI